MRQSSLLLFASLFFVALVFTGCDNDNAGTAGDIPFDEKRALESIISIDTAKQYQRSFISSRDSLNRPFQDTSFRSLNFSLPNAESFTRDAIIVLLNQKGADGIRVYYGKDHRGTVRLVLLPVDKNGKDIQTTLIDRGQQTKALSIPGISSAQAAPPSQLQAVENGQTCPPCIID